AVAAGLKIALGSDAGVFPHGTQGREFILMTENGMTPMQALVAGTSVAGLVAVAGDPLQNIEIVTRPVFVMHEGRIHKQE
ncbi:MAG: amidohydrolase family protein, partial [Acidobacteria bacterium]|nr:amidohydrolase family protein [Acidobacteriota bacterium]